ncbi:uncharacterized protein LOC142593203 [Pelecanus crispus]|uniref:uncharacterized protein LOC142593203 n=1 Tax=Pelecanus crispus TaxID=36300 RepID=UPI003F5D0A43
MAPPPPPRTEKPRRCACAGVWAARRARQDVRGVRMRGGKWAGRAHARRREPENNEAESDKALVNVTPERQRRVLREAVRFSGQAAWASISSPALVAALDLPSLNLSLPSEPWKNLEEIVERLSSSTEEQVSLAELPAGLDNTLMVPRSRLQHAAVTSYGYKLQCLRIQVRQIAGERDKVRLDLEKAERHCLQLRRELDEQYVALEHTQSKLK